MKKKQVIEKPKKPLQVYQAIINDKKEVVEATSVEEAQSLFYLLAKKHGKRNRS